MMATAIIGGYRSVTFRPGGVIWTDDPGNVRAIETSTAHAGRERRCAYCRRRRTDHDATCPGCGADEDYRPRIERRYITAFGEYPVGYRATDYICEFGFARKLEMENAKFAARLERATWWSGAPSGGRLARRLRRLTQWIRGEYHDD